MMKVHISLDLAEVDLLNESHKFFAGDTGDILSASELVTWAVRMLIAARDDANNEAK